MIQTILEIRPRQSVQCAFPSLQHTILAVISLTSARLAFGHVDLLDHADFSLEAGERVGLIGRNGTGKSSLLKIISGRSKLDDGLLVMQQGLKIAYVEQEPVFDPAMTVFDAVAGGMGEQQAMLAEYESLTGQFGQGNDDALMERMHELQHKLDALDAWNIGNKVETTLDRLGLAGAGHRHVRVGRKTLLDRRDR